MPRTLVGLKSEQQQQWHNKDRLRLANKYVLIFLIFTNYLDRSEVKDTRRAKAT